MVHMEENLPATTSAGPELELPAPPEEEVVRWDGEVQYSGDSVEEWVKVEETDLISLEDAR